MPKFESMFEAIWHMSERMDEFDAKGRDANGQKDPDNHDWEFAAEMETMFQAMIRFEEAMERANDKKKVDQAHHM